MDGGPVSGARRCYIAAPLIFTIVSVRLSYR